MDFYCHRAGLVVEADGPIHDTQQEHDEDRDAVLKLRGLRILRFSNEQILQDLDSVLEVITLTAQNRLPRMTDDI